MQQQLKAYYLQQMGIQTWVRRDLPKPAPRFQMMVPVNTPIDLVIAIEDAEPDATNNWVTGKVGQLIKNMLFSIGISVDNVAIFCSKAITDNHDLSVRDALLQEQLIHINPKLIWVLGAFSTTCLQANTLPVMTTIHPHLLLQAPLQKKKVLADLMMIKRALEPSA